MKKRKLDKGAGVVLLLNALYNIGDSLCSVFVAVYFYLISQDFMTVCYHYLALYIVTPIVFLFAGWYSQARDRVHVFRLGLVLHAVYYATLLWLREDSPHYAVPLGALLGVTWGFFWAGNNTFNFDVTTSERREYYFGLLSVVVGLARLGAPLLSALIIHFAPTHRLGYHVIFFVAVVVYIVALVASLWVPHDRKRRPFRIKRALFPGRDQWDWRFIMLAAATLAGSFSIFQFLLGLVMFMQTGSELSVGGFAALQALAAIGVSYIAGRVIVPANRRKAMLLAVCVLVAAGALISLKLTVLTLVLFGFMRSAAQPLFSIPHWSVRLDVIANDAEEPAQRIEYMCAWEVPLAIGRIVMMSLIILLATLFEELGLRIALFLLCANRILTYFFLSRISLLRDTPKAR